MLTDNSKSAMLNVKQVAVLLNCSQRHVFRLAQAGSIPKPRKLGTLVRWSRSELEKWIAEGCPTMANQSGDGGKNDLL